jgi:hypothetical protein
METNNLPDKETLQIWIDGLADALQYLTLTDNQGHNEERDQACFTVAIVREMLQGLAEEIDKNDQA